MLLQQAAHGGGSQMKAMEKSPYATPTALQKFDLHPSTKLENCPEAQVKALLGCTVCVQLFYSRLLQRKELTLRASTMPGGTACL